MLQLKYTDYNQRWGDGNILELVVMIVHDSEYTKITESCTFLKGWLLTSENGTSIVLSPGSMHFRLSLPSTDVWRSIWSTANQVNSPTTWGATTFMGVSSPSYRLTAHIIELSFQLLQTELLEQTACASTPNHTVRLSGVSRPYPTEAWHFKGDYFSETGEKWPDHSLA